MINEESIIEGVSEEELNEGAGKFLMSCLEVARSVHSSIDFEDMEEWDVCEPKKKKAKYNRRAAVEKYDWV